MLLSLQTNLIFIMTILYGSAVKPPGYVQPSEAPDTDPPKYEYGYKISDEKGGQGKQEQRDGIYALGRYYVQGENSKQDIQYFADNWGYHPVVEYSSVGPHSQSTTKFALGTEAVQQLKNKENNLPQLQGIFNGNERLDTLNTAPSDQPGNTQSVSQPQVQIFTTQPQIQETLQEKQEGNSGPLPEGLTVGQQEVQPVLLSGEFQQQPLQIQTTDSQLNDKPQTLLPKAEAQSVDTQQQNQDKNLKQILSDQGQQQQINQQGTPEGQKQFEQQLLEQNQQLQQTTEITQGQFNLGAQHQFQQIIINHEEPTQQIIFPQQSQTGIILNQNANTQDISRTSGQQTEYVQFLPRQEALIQQSQLVSEVNTNNQEPTHSELNNDDNKKVQQELSVDNSDQTLIKAEQRVSENQNNGYNLENYNNDELRVTSEESSTNKLIEHTKNLVNGQDVLNINEAITREHNINIESSTPQSAITEHEDSQVLSENTIRNILINHGEIFSSPAPHAASSSLNEQPIVVAELDDNTSQTSANGVGLIQENYQSFVSTTPGTVSTDFDITGPSTVIVTPRPVSSSVLAPITAGVQLQNIEVHTEDQKNFDKEEYKVEVQQSLPYYLGKIEYPVSAYSEQLVFNSTANETNSAELSAEENIELGKTLLFFPGQNLPLPGVQHQPQFVFKQPVNEVNNDINVQQLPLSEVKENFVDYDQQQVQGYQHQVTVQQTAVNYVTPVPTEITKIIHQPYAVEIPYQVPYPVLKQVPVPVTVQKIVEKPIHVTKYVEKPVPIPQPYPVHKVVEKPVHVPVQVTKYIDRPYPVEVRVPYPQPYPVEKIVQKIIKQPYPVEVRVPVEKIVEKKVPVPQYVEKPVEKIVEKPVPHYIDRPYPVEVKVPIPQPYFVQVEVPRYPIHFNKLMQKPYGQFLIPPRLQPYAVSQNVRLKFPLHIYNQESISNKNSEQQSQQSQQQQTYIYANPYAYAPQINQYLSPKQESTLNNGYLPVPQINNYYPPKNDCDQQNLDTSLRNVYYAIKPDDYIGLLPPKVSSSQLNAIGKLRTARSNFDEKNIRMEYGFMPPLIPSLEIDEQGNPIDKSEK